ncbi:tetratricopeptide repeat protein [Streptacidiphilus rugosus]|uniref:tetratricopeptide repeat protein n=1 Tax=Streptacidiphilus rugosus TaxID=405783 RepID=UPI00068D4C4E|nr:tetratricopeptide repeat protein [Streptacidiphilus rugosus]
MGLFGGERGRQKRVAADLTAKGAGLQPYFAAGRSAETEPRLRAWLDEAESVLGPRHKVTLQLRTRLAQLCNANGRFAEAEHEAATVLELTDRDVADAAAGTSWEHYAAALNHQGRHEEAAREYAALGRALAEDPAQKVRLLTAQVNRTSALLYLDRFEEAEHEAGRALQAAQSVAGPTGLYIRLTAANSLSRVLTAQGRAAEAETVARQALVSATGSGQPVDRFQRLLALNLAGALSAQGRHQEALDAVAEATGVGGHEFAADTGAVGSARARALLGLGRREEAVAVAEEALAEALARFGGTHARVTVLRELLAEAGAAPGHTGWRG